MSYEQSTTNGDRDLVDCLKTRTVKLRNKIKHFEASGIIFWRQDLDDNTPLKLRFAVIKNGSVDIYRNENEFMKGCDPLNSRSIDLSQYAVQSDYNHFPTGNTTVGSIFNKAVAGQSEFSVLEIASSDYDLVLAIKKFRLFLVPRILNEVKPLKIAEFMCTDEEAYKKWLAAFRQGCR